MVKRARKTDALALAAGETDAALADLRVKAAWQFRFNELEDLRHGTGFTQMHQIDLIIRQTKRDVARDRVVDEKNILWHVTDGRLPRRYQRCRQRLAVDHNLACGWLI